MNVAAEHETMTEADEEALEQQQARRNRILGWTLAILALLIMGYTMFKMFHGFNPFVDQDIFRS